MHSGLWYSVRQWAAKSVRSSLTSAARRTGRTSRLEIEPLEDRLLLTAYYVSKRATASDTNNGLTPRTAWATIDRVNQQNLEPGDSVAFQAGQIFDGAITLTAQDTGTSTSYITLSSYGIGRATINSGDSAGLSGFNVQGINVNNLIFTGSGMFSNGTSGIGFVSYKTDGTTLRHFHIDNVEASGYGGQAVAIEASTGFGYIQDVRITNSVFHHNLRGGVTTSGPGATSSGIFTKTISDVYVGHVTVYDNAGILLGGVNGGIIERSVVYNTAYFDDVGAGIMAYNSTNVTIQFNEAYGVRHNDLDGNGFLLDWDTVNCVLQYNYSHDNDGAGFALFGSQGFGLPDSFNNTVRYNISEDDARRNSYGGITVILGVHNTEIYNNTVYMSDRAGTGETPLQVYIWSGNGLHFRNNIFITSGNVFAIMVFGPIAGTDLVFQGNNYYAPSAQFPIYYNDEFYTSLTAWRNVTNQEKLNGNPVGSSVDPQLTNPGGGGTIGNADFLGSLSAYTLKSTSSLRNSGLNLISLFGINPGTRDFYGNTIPNGGFSVGAHDPT